MIGQQLDAAVFGLGVDRAHRFAFLLQLLQGSECRLSRRVVANLGLALDPNLRDMLRIGDRLTAQRVFGVQRRLRVVLQLRGVIQPGGLECGADVLVIDEGIEVQTAISLFQQFQGVDGSTDGLAVLRLPAQIPGLHAQRAVEQVVNLSFDAGDFLDQLAVLLGFGGQQLIGLDPGAQISHDDFRVLLGVALINQCAVEGRGIGLRTVVDLASKSAVGEQLTKGHEVSVSIHFIGLQRRACHFRCLGNDVDVSQRVPALSGDRTQQHAVGGGGKWHRDGLALEVGQGLRSGSARHHDAVAAALDVAGQHTDEQAVLARRFKRHTIERTGEVGHGAEVQLAGDHFIGQRRATGEVLPLDVVGGVFVLAVVWQVLFQQAQFVHHLEGGGMHRVAAEIAQEVSVLFQHGNVHAGAGQKIAQHHAGGPAARDYACGGNLFHVPSLKS